MLSLDGQDLFPLVIGLRGAIATLAAVDSNEPFRGTSPVEQNEAGFRCELVLWLFFGGSVVVFCEFGFGVFCLLFGVFCVFVCLFSFWLPYTSLQWALLEGPQGRKTCVAEMCYSAQSSFLLCPQQRL